MSLGLQPGVLEGPLDAGDGAAAFGVAVGDAEGVGGRAVAGHFGVDAGAAALGVLQLFEDQHARAFAEDEAVAVQIERPRRLLRIVVVRRQGGEQVEAGDAERMDHAVRAAGEHEVGLAVADHLGRLADGLAAGGTGRQAVVIRPFQIEILRQMARRRVQLLFVFVLGVEDVQAARGEDRAYRRRSLSG